MAYEQRETKRPPALGRLMLSWWWLTLPLGIALIVVGIATGSDALQRGGPIVIGILLVMWGVAGAIRALGRRPS